MRMVRINGCAKNSGVNVRFAEIENGDPRNSDTHPPPPPADQTETVSEENVSNFPGPEVLASKTVLGRAE